MSTRGSLSQRGAPAAVPLATMDLVDKEYVDTAVSIRQSIGEKNAASGYCGLDSGAKVPAARLPYQQEYASGQTVTNSVTLANTSLSLSVETGGLYFLDAFLIYTAPTAADIKFALGGTAVLSTTSSFWTLNGLPASATTTAGTTLDTTGAAPTTALTSGGTGAKVAICPRGVLYATTGGTVVLQFAQATASTTGSTLTGFSWMRLNKW